MQKVQVWLDPLPFVLTLELSPNDQVSLPGLAITSPNKAIPVQYPLVVASLKKILYEFFPRKNKYNIPCLDKPLKIKYSLWYEVILITSA